MEIILSTFNSRYSHSAFALRYLRANLGDLRLRSKILEFTIQSLPRESAEEILSLRPKIVGFSVYLWNVELTTSVIRILKAVDPALKIIVGGPEVSHETKEQEICRLADHVIQGEGEVLFYELCTELLRGVGAEARAEGAAAPDSRLSRSQVISGPLPDVGALVLPYREYTDEDVENRVIYVEASRGCPFECEYCLSSLDRKVRAFPLEPLLAEFELLLKRGARQFKFIDRTFNLNAKTCQALLEFFHPWSGQDGLGVQLHFEMVPDRLPEVVRQWIERYPAGSLQFEIGIQTWSPEVAKRVSRKQDYPKIIENLTYLGSQPAVHIHADLIAGLPGEDFASFRFGFDALFGLGVEEIQVGVLKRLRGVPIARHSEAFRMVYQPFPPYTVLKTSVLSFEEVQNLQRISKIWDLFGNSGRFRQSVKGRLVREQELGRSPFDWIARLTQFVKDDFDLRLGISLRRQVELLGRFLLEQEQAQEVDVLRDLSKDLGREIKAEEIGISTGSLGNSAKKSKLPWARQRAHGAGGADPQ